MSTTAAIGYDAAMRLAVEHADLVKGSTYPNPPVGAVILDRDGRVAGAGGTEPAGSAHAEVVALRRAGRRAEGGTAVVTLEPCNHHGKTPPCVDALLDAGIASVVYAVTDPNPTAAGGAARLAAAGVHVVGDVEADLVAAGPLREWLHKQRTGLPHVTWKYATSIDGRSAAADGSSQWITSEAARADLHRRRAAADAIVVGTGTVLTDDPTLTARLADGGLADRQPLRVVVGRREIPSEAKVLNDDSRTMVIRTRDPAEVLQGAVRSHRRPARGRAHACRGIPAGGGDRPHPGLRRADPAGRTDRRGRRRRGAEHRPGAALALRRHRTGRPGSAAEPGAPLSLRPGRVRGDRPGPGSASAPGDDSRWYC